MSIKTYLSVNVRVLRTVQVSDNDTVAVTVQEIFSLNKQFYKRIQIS